MGQEGIWGWDDTNKVWRKIVVNAEGKLIIDPSEIFEDTPTDNEVGKAPTSNWAYDEAVTRAAADLLRLLLTGGTLTGNLLIVDGKYLQLGDTDREVKIIPWNEAGVGGILVKPLTGNKLGFIAVEPTGTSERSQLSLYNVDRFPGNPYGAFSIDVTGDTVTFVIDNVDGPPTPITRVQFTHDLHTLHLLPIRPGFDNIGSITEEYYHIYAMEHMVFQDIDTDHRPSGVIALMTAGTNLTYGQAVYVGGDGKMEKAKADDVATMPTIALTARATIAEDAENGFLLHGFMRDNTWDWTPGGLLYISKDTAGALTQTKPTGSGEQAQPVGVAITAAIIYFSPETIESAGMPADFADLSDAQKKFIMVYGI